MQVDVPETIQGPVFISVATLTGYEFGSTVLNPYRTFLPVKPAAAIDNGVFVYEGSFPMKAASALGHATRAGALKESKDLPASLAEANRAVEVDPESLPAQMVLGEVLAALGEKEKSRSAYGRALTIAQTMEPSAKADWVPKIEARLKD